MTHSKAKRLVQRESAGEALEGVHPLLSRVYRARGIDRADELDLALSNLAPISALASIDEAVELLCAHREKRIIIVGDFDADGATSTALVVRCLRAFGFVDVDFLVPNRFDYGYGLSPEIVDVAADSKPSMLLTVDNGISSVAGVERAHELGIKVLITDHHLPPTTLPNAEVIINPNMPGDDFPSKHLAGVGVAFCLMAALGRHLQATGVGNAEAENWARVPARFLDLVALGTVADVVVLDRNNRILVNAGLARMRAGQVVAGISALCKVADRDMSRMKASDLGFALGPRLNAAGRLQDMAIGIRCLLTDSAAEAAELAEQLCAINRERREIEQTMQDEALAIVDEIIAERELEALPGCLSLFAPQWHQGIVGLVASRVKERLSRPVIAFARADDGELKGSGRSVAGVHMRDLLEAVDSQNPGLIGKFGGHAMAAGLSLAEESLPRFTDALEQVMRSRFADAQFHGEILIDGEVEPSTLTIELAELIGAAGPWGQGFEEPLFRGEFVVDGARIVGEKHLKLQVMTDTGSRIDAIAFNQLNDGVPEPDTRLQIVYRLDVNEWRQRRSLQLMVEQWQPI